jgi:hypothetical protein
MSFIATQEGAAGTRSPRAQNRVLGNASCFSRGTYIRTSRQRGDNRKVARRSRPLEPARTNEAQVRNTPSRRASRARGSCRSHARDPERFRGRWCHGRCSATQQREPAHGHTRTSSISFRPVRHVSEHVAANREQTGLPRAHGTARAERNASGRARGLSDLGRGPFLGGWSGGSRPADKGVEDERRSAPDQDVSPATGRPPTTSGRFTSLARSRTPRHSKRKPLAEAARAARLQPGTRGCSWIEGEESSHPRSTRPRASTLSGRRPRTARASASPRDRRARSTEPGEKPAIASASAAPVVLG